MRLHGVFWLDQIGSVCLFILVGNVSALDYGRLWFWNDGFV